MTILVSVFGSAAHRWVGDDPGSDALTRALSRPFAGGVLVGLLIFPVVYPERPVIVATMVSLLIVVPVIRLLTPLVGASVRRAIYAVAVWIVVNLVRDYLVADPLLSRLMLLAEAVTVLGGIAWLLRPSRLTEVDRAGVGMRLLGVAARVVAVFLVLSIGANVVGNVTLAALLVGGILRSIFIGIVLYGALQVLEGVYFVLLRTPAASRNCAWCSDTARFCEGGACVSWELESLSCGSFSPSVTLGCGSRRRTCFGWSWVRR